MNLITQNVIRVLSEPYFNYIWCVDVDAESWGTIQKTTIYCNSHEDASKVSIGYEFDA